MDYDNFAEQIKLAHALLLPGGCFDSPEDFYVDAGENMPLPKRAKTYLELTKMAEKLGMSMLGICAGAQMIGGLHNVKMYHNVKEATHTDQIHKTKELKAHEAHIYPDNLLADIFGGNRRILVNSRHNESMINKTILDFTHMSDFKVYAVGLDDIPEAWGKDNVLCIQWHPETLSADGNVLQQKIFEWLALRAAEYKKSL